jgi:hypothetical protein
MTNPNIKDPAGIYGETDVVVLTNTLTQIVANTSNSGFVYKINAVRGCNVTASQATMDVSLYRSTTHFYQCKDAVVESTFALIPQNREEYIWLKEGDALYAKANANSTIHLTISYERMGG